MTYTNIFGGYNINTAFPSYMSYTFSANIQLNWASSFVDSPPGTNNVTAQINDLNATGVGLTVTLADATLISVGQTIQFNNVGANSVIINDFSGGFIATIPPTNNNQYILYLRDNTTQAGTWGITHLGAGTSMADANALAGLGTISLNSQINTNFPGKTINANYQVLLSDRASILVWTGGTGTITLPNNLNGFYVAVNNEGSGVVTINTPDGATIDGQATLGINPGGSSYFIGVNANWNTLGNGIETFFRVQTLTIPLTNSNVDLTNQQSAALVQQYTGNITANLTVFYPPVAGQWYVWNFTNGAFTVSAQLAGPTGGSVVIPQGEKVILYSDGNSIYNTPTIATNATFPDGTVGAPGINFAQQSSTGFYRISSGLTGYSSAGTQGLTLGGPTPGYGLGISGGLATRYYNVGNGNFVGFRAPALPTGIIWSLPSADSVGTEAIVSNGAGILSFQSFVTSVTGTAGQIDVANPTTTPIVSIDPAYIGQASITTLGIITTGTWHGTIVDVPHGGTGLATLTTPFGVVCAGTTATNPLQNAGTGLVNQVFTSNGVGALPSWQSINISLPAAVKADEIAGTSTTVYTNPAVQQFHPSSAKFWCFFNGTTVGNNPPLAGYNVASVNRTGVGLYTITFTVPFTTINYCVIGTCSHTTVSSTDTAILNVQFLATGSVQIRIANINTLAADSSFISVCGFGLQ